MFPNLVGKRTIIFNSVMALVLIYNMLSPDAPVEEGEVVTFVDQLIAHLDAVITIVGNVFLRFKTKTPIFKKL